MRRTLTMTARAGVVGLALLAAGCASTGPTPYQPIESSSRIAGGYSEERLAEGLYRVTFAGNRLTSRERVEAYLLYRAAELSLQQGYDWFVIVDREVERHVEQRVSPDLRYDPWFARDYSYWRPYWRYYGPATGWRDWYPYSNDPFWADRVDVQSVEHYQASAEVRMGRGIMPSTNVRAFDARDVIDQMRSRIELP